MGELIIWSNLYDFNNDKYKDKVINLSQYNILEDDENSDIEDDIVVNNQFSIDNEKILNEINEIMKIKLNTNTDIINLKNQDMISTYLGKYFIQNNSLNYDFVIKLLKHLYETSSYFTKKLNLRIYKHDIIDFKKNDGIPRCSYKFCSFKDKCTYNYDDKKGGCYADHYVHNMVMADIDMLMNYLTYHKMQQQDSNKLVHNQEIIKCMNTISFVIKHMYEELNNICLYVDKSQHNKYHINRKASNDKHKKKNDIRRKH